MKVKVSDGRIFQVDYEWNGGDPIIEVIYDAVGEVELYISSRLAEARRKRGARPPETDRPGWIHDDETRWEIEKLIIERFDPADYYSDLGDR